MRIELPREAERFGSNLFYGVQKIYELDAGSSQDTEFSSQFHVVHKISPEKIYEVESQMAIIIPVKNERLKLLEGVLCGIPHACLPIIVSNSTREPTNRFRMEYNAVDNFCRFAKKRYVIVHQKDDYFSNAFEATHYQEILNEQGMVKNGKAEGMIMGILLAKFLGKKYVGFIDADNFFPGAVFEYIRIYSSTFASANSIFSMTRILWHSKPKVIDSNLFFAKWGRVTRITNNYLNRLISLYTGFETDVIKTGNAGEHAMSIDLAMLLDYSAGFSIETYHFINLIEQFGGILESKHPDVMQNAVEIYQVESRNPHLHEVKNEEHIKEMIEHSLSVIFHSPISPSELKKEILRELKKLKIIEKENSPIQPTTYKALQSIDLHKFFCKIDLTKYCNFSTN
ncbi:MAG: mannosyl-3-phosphoglycerate synthase [Thermoflexibacter sp.]|jgi:mannosyl-3-phosphoglycerate synthase|nr:mannosyl-3-phosphoglycerate synthase [Thermoflexibacter sp.]